MAIRYTITYEQTHIEIHVSGELDYLSSDRLWKDIAAACQEYNCRRILGVADVRRWPMEHAYDHAAIFEVHGMTPDHRIAWVVLNPDVVELARLAEAVVRNRGLANGRIFENIDEAKRWLTKESDDT